MTNAASQTETAPLTEAEIDRRVDWIHALCNDDTNIGGVRYRAAERAVRNRIDAETFALCGHSYPHWDATAESGWVEGPTVTDYDDQALAHALDVCAAYYGPEFDFS